MLSVIIPVYNGGEDFLTCLSAMHASSRPADEIIVVDDSSTDASAAAACKQGAMVVSLAGAPHGPAYARNQGVEQSRGDLLVFIDADVAIHPDTLDRIQATFDQNPQISALFGSYDNHPQKPGLVSRYKNLQHHYVHQNGQREASTFWAGCGAVRRDAFLKLGGFSQAYPRPSIEDIEFGLRLRGSGHQIYLCPEVQVTHLKRWTLLSLLRSDIRDRAIPWTRLILSSSHLPADLNLDQKSRLSAVAAWGSLVSLIASVFYWPALSGVIIAVAAQVILNLGFYRMFFHHEGIFATAGAFLLHSLYFLYSSAIFAIMFIGSWLRKNLRRVSAFFSIRKQPVATTKVDQE